MAPSWLGVEREVVAQRGSGESEAFVATGHDEATVYREYAVLHAMMGAI